MKVESESPKTELVFAKSVGYASLRYVLLCQCKDVRATCKTDHHENLLTTILGHIELDIWLCRDLTKLYIPE